MFAYVSFSGVGKLILASLIRYNGARPRNFISRNICFEFSVQCVCSVGTRQSKVCVCMFVCLLFFVCVCVYFLCLHEQAGCVRGKITLRRH